MGDQANDATPGSSGSGLPNLKLNEILLSESAEEERPQTVGLSNVAKSTNVTGVDQHGAQGFGNASRSGEDRSPAAAGRLG